MPWAREIDIVKAYLALEAMRYEERLRVSFDVDPALDREPCPRCCSRPFGENAVRHGIATLSRRRRLRTSWRPKDGRTGARSQQRKPTGQAPAKATDRAQHPAAAGTHLWTKGFAFEDLPNRTERW